ncbi:jg4064, partial [Pararge aegeria aegeria]
MKTGRSTLMLTLVEESSKNIQITNFTHEECSGEDNSIPGTPDDLHGTGEIIKSTDENNKNPSIPSPSIPSYSCVFREDPFVAVYQNASSPYLLPSENQHDVVSFSNISLFLTPLNTSTLISDLLPFPQPITPAVDND